MKNYFKKVGLGLCACLLLATQTATVRAEDAGFEQKGPATVKLGSDIATLNLPNGFGYIGEARTKAMIEKGGGSAQGVLGFVGSVKKADYSILLSFEDAGYTEDSDGDKLDADALLKSMKEGTEAQNEERKKRGLPGLHVVGWDEVPHYDKAKHIVIWSVKGSVDGQSEPIVNYNTRVLGRKGRLEVNLICDQANLQKYKPEVGKVLDSIAYNQGQRYEDYTKGDKISAGGIAALVVGGIALKKLGVLAFLGGFFKPLLVFGAKLFAVAGKAIVFVFAGIAGFIKNLFGRGKKNEDPPTLT